MRFRTILENPIGMRYVFNNLKIESSFSRHLLLESKMTLDRDRIEDGLREFRQFHSVFGGEAPTQRERKKIQAQLSHLKDIRTTIAQLSTGGTLDDIEFFELKNLAMINQQVRELLKEVGFSIEGITLPCLKEVAERLDPEGLKINSFYIYDGYHPELKELREKIREREIKGGRKESDDADKKVKLLKRVMEVESEIKQRLAGELRPLAGSIELSLHLLGKIDILLAKTELIDNHGFSIPIVNGEQKSALKGLFNPRVRSILEQSGKKFQNIDIEFDSKMPLLITGANMGGKSVTLRSVALAQYLFQFGFPVPAAWAELAPVAEVVLAVEKEQSIEQGLSSFGAEMVELDKILKRIKSGEFVLALIDEPASTTNPLEGTALVTALLKVIARYDSQVIATTHYNIELIGCRRMRVRGLIDNEMDYSLIEDSTQSVPQEALRIATLLEVDKEWIEQAESEMKKISKQCESRVE